MKTFNNILACVIFGVAIICLFAITDDMFILFASKAVAAVLFYISYLTWTENNKEDDEENA